MGHVGATFFHAIHKPELWVVLECAGHVAREPSQHEGHLLFAIRGDLHGANEPIGTTPDNAGNLEGGPPIQSAVPE